MGLFSLPRVARAAVLVLGPSPAEGQLPVMQEYRIRSFGPDDGLPLAEVWDVARDVDGRLIASTAAGLFRYTGYRFVPLSLGELEDAIFRDLEVSDEGEVWFVTAAGIVGRVRNGRAHGVGSPGNQPWRLQRGPDGRMWAVGLKGLVAFDSVAPGRFVGVARDDGCPDCGRLRDGRRADRRIGPRGAPDHRDVECGWPACVGQARPSRGAVG